MTAIRFVHDMSMIVRVPKCISNRAQFQLNAFPLLQFGRCIWFILFTQIQLCHQNGQQQQQKIPPSIKCSENIHNNNDNDTDALCFIENQWISLWNLWLEMQIIRANPEYWRNQQRMQSKRKQYDAREKKNCIEIQISVFFSLFPHK